ncbi:DUF4931 domain-containing protein [Streptococcus dentapri]|uniref:DUF4931 domain-containing protein n=1 Tax=Streptococcus dentapri TaxID=573564 RepID=A0ABV8CZL8_9STRE
MNQPLIFNPHIARSKPNNHDACPFCDISHLEKIIDQKDNMIWLDNKYPVLEGVYQTLIIESDKHLGDIATYSQNHNRKLFAFALKAWQELENSGRFKSVGLFKNFGPLSGGSLRHPHMQVIGFENLDAYADIKPENFDGYLICQQTASRAKVTLSKQPLSTFSEFNVSISHLDALDHLADMVQALVQYVMSLYSSGRCSSYNLFFYRYGETIICKIVPRFVASPYLIGYRLTQVSHRDRREEEIAELRQFLNEQQSKKREWDKDR